MNRQIRNVSQLALISLFGWSVSSCNREATDTTPQGECRIQTSVIITTSIFAKSTDQTNYAYDPAGRLLGVTMTQNRQPTSGTFGTQTGSKISRFTYDASGYLTASATDELYTTVSNTTTREQITTTQSFSYTSGRLSGYTTRRVGAYGLTFVSVNALDYDASGELLTNTETSSTLIHDPSLAKEKPFDSGSTTRVWTYRNRQLADYVENAGTPNARKPLTIQNGVVTKIGDPNYEIRYEYDARQRITKQEIYRNGTLTEYFIQTWNEAKPASTAVPVFRGFPTYGLNSFAYSNGIGNAATRTSYQGFYLNTVSNVIQPFNTVSSVVQTNAAGFVTGITSTDKHPTATDQDTSTIETNTYAGCP